MMLAIQNVVNGDHGPLAVAGQQAMDCGPVTWPGPTPLSETEFNGVFAFIVAP